METALPFNSVFANVFVSYYRHVGDMQPATITLYALLISGKHKGVIERLRAIVNEDEQSQLKEGLPGFTPSARMHTGVTRSEAAIYRHSGFLCVDIDRKDNIDVRNFFELKDEFKKLPFVACCKSSCRGGGYFLVIPIEDPEKHKLYFEWLTGFFEFKGLKIDTKPGNPSSFRFVSYDEQTYFNHNAVRFDYCPQPKEKTVGDFTLATDAEGERANVEYCISEICRLKIDITTTVIKMGNREFDRYGTWFSIGCSFAGTYGIEGKDYYQHVSQFYDGYTEAKTSAQFKACLKWANLKPGLKAFYDACKAFGIFYKQRPGYLPNTAEGTQKSDAVNTLPVIENLTKPNISIPIEQSQKLTKANILPPVSKIGLTTNFGQAPETAFFLPQNTTDIEGETSGKQQKEVENRAFLAFERWICYNPNGGLFYFDNQTFRVTLKAEIAQRPPKLP
ncbi:MAG TPA: BT4734/BF3469 family protein [Chitinophagaceae bacterium]|nr:BT4734/BF3469 family protein [Chitinophagaceae bacterium]